MATITMKTICRGACARKDACVCVCVSVCELKRLLSLMIMKQTETVSQVSSHRHGVRACTCVHVRG